MEIKPISVKYTDLTYDQREWLNNCKATWVNGYTFNYLQILSGFVIFDKKTFFYFNDLSYIPEDFYHCKTGKEFCQAVAEKLDLICDIPKEKHFSKMEIIDLNLSIPIQNKLIVPGKTKLWVAWHPEFGYDFRYFSKWHFPKKDLKLKISQIKSTPSAMETYFSKLQVVPIIVNPIIN